MTNPYGTATKRAPKSKPTRPYPDVVFSTRPVTHRQTRWTLDTIIEQPGRPPKEIRRSILEEHDEAINMQVIDGCIKRLREMGLIRGEKISQFNPRTMGWWVVPENEKPDRPFKLQEAGGGDISESKGQGILGYKDE